MKENDYFYCLMCRKVLNNAMERKQHLRMHREKNETCAISDSNRKTIIYYKKGYIPDDDSGEDAPKQIDTMKLRDKIREEIEKLEKDDRIQGSPANVFVNAPLALIQRGIKGQIDGLQTALRILEESEEI